MLLDQQLEAIVESNLINGQAVLAHHIRTLVYKKAPQWFDRLDYEDDQIFLEPALFAWFTDPAADTPLSQQLLGLVMRHSVGRLAADVKSDACGIISVPRIGRFCVEETNAAGTLKFDDRGWVWHPGDKSSGICCRPRLESFQIVAPQMIIGQGQPPSVARRFFSARTDVDAGLPANATAQYQYLQTALQMMARQDVDLHEWIAFSTRYIHLYHGYLPNSFASLSVHGAAFLNVPEDACVVFYLDDLAHQCGHIIFNAVTLQKDAYLMCDPNTPLKSITNDINEPRSVYSTYHGLFTYTLIIRCLSRCMPLFSAGNDRLHALARIAFYIQKFQQDLHALNFDDLYTPLGKKVYQIFRAYYGWCCDEYSDHVMGFDLSNQLYVFSWQRFSAVNGLKHPVGEI